MSFAPSLLPQKPLMNGSADTFGYIREGFVRVIIPPSFLKFCSHLPEMLKKPQSLKSCLQFSGFLLFSQYGDAYCRGLQEAEGHQRRHQTVPTPWLKQATSVVSLKVLLSPPAESKPRYIPVA